MKIKRKGSATRRLRAALDQNAAHSLGGGREEVAAAGPVLRPAPADQPQVCFVDENGRL